MKTKISCVCIVVVLMAAGCATSGRYMDLTVVSTKEINTQTIDLDSLPATPATGKDSKFMVLGIPIGHPHMDKAIEEALINGNGDMMTDCVVHGSMLDLIFFGTRSITVNGQVVDTRSAQMPKLKIIPEEDSYLFENAAQPQQEKEDML